MLVSFLSFMYWSARFVKCIYKKCMHRVTWSVQLVALGMAQEFQTHTLFELFCMHSAEKLLAREKKHKKKGCYLIAWYTHAIAICVCERESQWKQSAGRTASTTQTLAKYSINTAKVCVFAYFFLFAFGWKATHRWWETQENACRLIALVYWGIAICACACMYHIEKKVPDEQQAWHTTCEHKTKKNTTAEVHVSQWKDIKLRSTRQKKNSSGVRTACMCQNENRGEESSGQQQAWHKTWEHMNGKKNTMAELCVCVCVCVCVYVCVCVCVPQVCTDEGEGAGECINLPQISTVVLGLSQPSSHLNNMMSLFPQMLLRGGFLPPLPLPKQAISLAPSYPVALTFHHNDERTWDGVATINALCPVGDYWLQCRLTAVDLPRGVRRKELTSEKKCPAAMKERKKDYWTSKSVAHVRITRESRSQSRSTPSAVLEDTMHLVDLFLSAFAPSWIAKGSMRSIDLDDDRTSGRAGGRMACCSGALRAITVGAENARSRVLAGPPRDSGRHFVSKCSHCACSVSHERGPNARSYVKSPPPPPTHARTSRL